jgi:hypothetical protein
MTDVQGDISQLLLFDETEALDARLSWQKEYIEQHEE